MRSASKLAISNKIGDWPQNWQSPTKLAQKNHQPVELDDCLASRPPRQGWRRSSHQGRCRLTGSFRKEPAISPKHKSGELIFFLPSGNKQNMIGKFFKGQMEKLFSKQN